MDRHAPPLTAFEESAARSGIYRLLARLWLREIDQDSLRELCTAPLRDAFINAGGVVPTRDDIKTIERLAADYCQLFVGPTNHLPPIQSVWETGQLQSATTTSVRAFIDIIGYPAEELPSGAMLDHLGVQLDVMAHILAQISICPTGEEQRAAILELAESFLTMHLTWASELLAVAVGRATTEFYRSIITLTRDFLEAEISAADGKKR